MKNEQARSLPIGSMLGDILITGFENNNKGDVVILGTCTICGASRKINCRKVRDDGYYGTTHHGRNCLPPVKERYPIGSMIGDIVIEDIVRENGETFLLGTCTICGAKRRIMTSRIGNYEGTIHHGKSCNPPVKERYPIGTILGDMTVINHVLNNDGSHIDLLCKCNICGEEKQIYISNLKRWPGVLIHTSCIYGKLPRLRQIHTNMLDRIYNPENSHYALYGGRGLTTDYDNYADFYRDYAQAYIDHCEKYGEENTTLDRINNDLGYVTGNMRFLTMFEQGMNRRFMKNNFYFCFEPGLNGRIYATDNMSAFCRNHGIIQANAGKVIHGERNHANGWVIRRVTDLPEYVLFRPADLIYEYYGISDDYKAIELPPLPEGD